MPKSLVIIPTVRNPSVISDYAANIELHGFDKKSLHFLIVTEDNAEKSEYKRKLDESGLSGEIFGATERERFMGENGISEYLDIIPRKSHAETSFGLIYLLIHREFEYGFFIDDDTKPVAEFDYFGGHLGNLAFKGEVDSAGSEKGWLNVLYQSFSRHGLYPRGYPYSVMGEKTSVSRIGVSEGSVFISHGLWTNVPDLDAIRILMDGDLNGQARTRLRREDFTGNFVAEKGSFQTVCSMNLAFRREIIPAFYQMPMDDNPYRVGRFDDIWSGFVAKAVLDRIGGLIMNGYPLCEHNKAPRSTFKDVASESPGYESNEFFAETIRNTSFSSADVQGLTEEIADKLEKDGKTEFVRYCGKYLGRWTDLCEKKG